jgi:hypothetical protein
MERAQRDSAKKTSKFGLNQLMLRIETQVIVECLHIMFFDEYDEYYKKRND